MFAKRPFFLRVDHSTVFWLGWLSPPLRPALSLSFAGSPRQHTKVAMEKSHKELYIRSTVSEILHDLCLDTEVPPSQRKFERKKMSR